MALVRRSLIAGIVGISVGASAFAQAPSVTRVRIRGTVDSVDSSGMSVTPRVGDKVTVTFAPNAVVRVIAPIAIDAIKPGSFIGTAAMSQPDGTLKALEIQVFPESMRGVGEGHQPWDVQPGSTMTNGTVGDLKVSDGRILTLTYKGGEQKVYVPENAPIITYEPGTLASVTPGSHVIVFATRSADGALAAASIGVGKDGLVPPM